MDNNLKGKVEQCCRTSEEFTKFYYSNIDKSRHQMSRLYLDSGLLIWNGNGTTGKDDIQRYILELPSSEHRLHSLDAQPILDEAVSGQLTYLLQTGGTVKFQNHPVKHFQQTFVITAQGDKWKIVSDCYRLQDALSSNREKK